MYEKYFFLGAPGEKCFVPRGKGVGGSSLINAIIYSRGNKYDYDKWSDMLADPGWNYENLLPYFKKSETFIKTNPHAPIDDEYHGFNGPLHMSNSFPPEDIDNLILEGKQLLGYNLTDYNGKQQLGYSVFQYFSKDGKRFDPGMAFISSAKDRTNLKVLDKSYVTKIDISKDTKKVNGVFFTRGGKTYHAKSRKEVVLSAGAISSPQILMLSGIGPKNHLESVGIPVIQDLPVGEKLHDHTFTPIVISLNESVSSVDTQKTIEQFLNRRGPMTRPFTVDAVGWYKTPIEPIENYPNMEIFFYNLSDSVAAKRFFGYSDKTYEAINAKVPNPMSVILSNLHTKSIGSVKLRTADPFDYPLIDPNILCDDDDMETLYQGLQILLKLMETEPFRKLDAKLAFKEFPGCAHTKPLSKEYWYCYFRRTTTVGVHPSTSCLTGRNRKTGVVDKRLKVFGVKGLRVADASVIPLPVSAHTNAVCSMIGEKAPDLIKEDYNYA